MHKRKIKEMGEIPSEFEMKLRISDDGPFTSYISFRKRILRY